MRVNRPIQTPVKGKRLVTREPIDATSWAYMKLLREHNDTMKIYDVDPYVEVYQARPNIYALLTISADGMGDPWMYMIDGPEKALLIDTSFGIGDLRGLCRELTGGKELYVVNTHTSYDHSYGNCQFDRCYCHKAERAEMETKKNPHIWDYLFDENGKGIWLDFDRNDVVKYKDYETVYVDDGYTWDLGGGYEIELIWVPGHKPGHAMFLDKRARILFAGDDILSMRVGMGRGMQYATVEAYLREMKKLNARITEFDYILPGHFFLEIESSVIPYFVETAKQIMADPQKHDFFEERTAPDGSIHRSYQKYVHNMGTIAYGDSNVYEPREVY